MKKKGAWLCLKLLDLLLCSTVVELLRGQQNGKRVQFSCTRSALWISLTTRISKVWMEDCILCSLVSVAAVSSFNSPQCWGYVFRKENPPLYSAWIRQCIKKRDLIWCLDFVENIRNDTIQSSLSYKSLQCMAQALRGKILKRDWNPIFRKDPCIQEINSHRNWKSR